MQLHELIDQIKAQLEIDLPFENVTEGPLHTHTIRITTYDQDEFELVVRRINVDPQIRKMLEDRKKKTT